ncbi:MAG: homocysteine S-methyltransferase family protein [Planctomycetota bacterium]|nr:homocysteine S-methyltransferase family protein [Planctomycetota bacterium]
MTLNFAQLASAVRVLDGAWGTELQKRCLPAGHATELWNIENPDAVEAVADGSEVSLTNTFGANRFVLERHGLGERVAQLARAGVAISRRAAGRAGALVFAAIGPTGKIVMTGEVSPDELTAAFAQTARALADAGADALILESFAELEEIELALQAVKSACSLPDAKRDGHIARAIGPDGPGQRRRRRRGQLRRGA